jgi:hypothetical protein
MNTKDLYTLSHLNAREKMLNEVQDDINRARKKYSDVSVIQLRLDRRQAALDIRMARLMQEKGKVLNPN